MSRALSWNLENSSNVACQRCFDCLNEHQAVKPGVKADWDDSSEDDDSDEDSDGGVTNNYESLVRTGVLPYIVLNADILHQASDIDGVSASMQMLTAQNLEYHAGSEHPRAQPSVEDTEISSVASNKDKMPAHDTASTNVSAWNTYAKANSKRPTEFTGYDPSGVAHRQIRAPSTVASDDYRSRAPRASKFAKVKVRNTGELPHHQPLKSDSWI